MNELLRRSYADAFIALVMDDADHTATDLTDTEERLAIIAALGDAIAFFSNPDHWSEIT